MRLTRKKYFILVILLFPAIYATRANSADDISISAKSAIIAEASTGKILYEKNPDLRLEPASTVKVMTAILALEAFPRDKEITLTNSVNHVEPVVINLKSGVSYKVEDLIYALLIKSANNAAVAISESISGSEREFINLMNNKAHAIGMKDTHFTSSSGLPYGNRKDQYTTARDLITLMRYAAKNKTILEAMSKKEVVIKGNNGHTIRLESHNKSLFTGGNTLWGKTGYTRTAKRTFVGVDPSYKPRIVVALLKSNDLWGDIRVLKKHGLKLYEKRQRFFLFKLVDLVFG